MVLNWGVKVQPHWHLLELGCGDGYLGALIANQGYHYTGIDSSQGMIDEANKTAGGNPNVKFYRADVSSEEIESVDVIFAFFRTFLRYVKNPGELLLKIYHACNHKILIDVDPREENLKSLKETLKKVGFKKILCRPFFVPMKRKIPLFFQYILFFCEKIPIIRNVILRFKFHILITAEK